MIVGLAISPYRLDLLGTLQSLIGVAIVIIPVMFGIGYLIAIKSFSALTNRNKRYRVIF